MVHAERSAGVDLTFELRLTGEGGGVWAVHVKDGFCDVRAGFSQRADVRLTAYQQRTTPLVPGSVIYVSGDRMLEQNTERPYYVVHIDVPAEGLAEAGNLKLQAGMPAEVFIRTDSRTASDYLLAPVTSYLRRAMREPM